MQQPDLAGFAAPGSSIHRLFFALWPGDELRRGIGEATSQLLQQHDAGGRRIGPRRYHLTLQFSATTRNCRPRSWTGRARRRHRSRSLRST